MATVIIVKCAYFYSFFLFKFLKFRLFLPTQYLQRQNIRLTNEFTMCMEFCMNGTTQRRNGEEN